jgi:hypothetical protein
MGKRLTQIATRTGDDGSTGLGDGSRTEKNSLRIAALGDVDELNSTIGLLLTEPLPEATRDHLTDIQHDLFDLGGELCIPGFENVADSQVLRLDTLLADYNADLPGSRNSSFRAARAPPRSPMSRGRCVGGQSARWSRSRAPSPCGPPASSTSTGCPTCCSCSPGCSTALPAGPTCNGSRARTE